MATIGVIMEVNPFHNGHEHFLKEVKKQIGDSTLICIVTTTITQRGDVSVLPKRIKAELLIENGVDLVVELPAVLANQGGGYYGYYNIKILNDLGVDKIYFGSESNNLELIREQIELEGNGNNFNEGYISGKIGNLKSNDILAMSYIKAINKINPNIKYATIKRIENNYNDDGLVKGSNICSATAIRENYQDENIKKYLPIKSYNNLNIKGDKELLKLFIFNMYNMPNDDIFLSEKGEIVSKISKVLNKIDIINNINDYTLEEICSLCSDKNNSKYKIRRIIMNVIFQVYTSDVNEYIKDLKSYKVLGFSKRYQSNLKNNSTLFVSYKELSYNNIYMLNDKIDKILTIYGFVNYEDNYKKPIII